MLGSACGPNAVQLSTIGAFLRLTNWVAKYSAVLRNHSPKNLPNYALGSNDQIIAKKLGLATRQKWSVMMSSRTQQILSSIAISYRDFTIYVTYARTCERDYFCRSEE